METALVALLDDLLREANRGKISLLVLLDISAAFDTAGHGILPGRLSDLGIGGCDDRLMSLMPLIVMI